MCNKKRKNEKQKTFPFPSRPITSLQNQNPTKTFFFYFLMEEKKTFMVEKPKECKYRVAVSW